MRPLNLAMDEDYSTGSADADREMTRLWRTWRTVFEMLQDRVCNSDSLLRKGGIYVANKCVQQGYEVTEEEVQIPLHEFKSKYSDPLGYPEYATSLFIRDIISSKISNAMPSRLQSQQDESQRSSHRSYASQIHTAT